MAKKARSGPMMEMLNRLTSFTSDGHAEFQTIFFEEEAILNHPIETWPTCEALIAFYSDGFPLRKVQQYAALRKPVVLNDLKKQEMLFDEASGLSYARGVRRAGAYLYCLQRGGRFGYG